MIDRRGVADAFEEIADLLELQGENAFKVRAYRNGARAVEALEEDLAVLVAADRLGEIRGLGKALVEKVRELTETGQLAFLENLRESVPAGLVALLEVPSLGPKKARKLYRQLGVAGLEDLRRACQEGRVAALEGFGSKTQERLLANLDNLAAYAARHHWWTAWLTAQPLLEGLRAQPGVRRAAIAGSLRRGNETVGDLDFLAAADDPPALMRWFCTREGVADITAEGSTKSSVRFENGLQADLRVVPEDRFAFALHHFTGSKDHNVRMRQRALERGWSLSEWGLFDAERVADASASALRQREPIVRASSEAELFAALDLPLIPPELREDRGEIEAAEAGGLPELVTESDLRGVFHNHTHASDGRNSLEEMAAAAEARGWEYLGIADHSKASFQAKGLDAERLMRQVEEIRRINASKRFRVTLLAGSEVDILADGSLDYPDEILKELDYVVASAHASLTQDRETMTARLIRAVEHPEVDMLGHPTGRLLLRREAAAVDLPKVIDAALATGTAIELNANPRRLELDWRYWRKAAKRGLRCAINPDAHHIDHFDFVKTGVKCARKGWLTARDVINCWPLDEVRSWLAER
ncbi:MAG: DNA polymerase/3'-5' exonuclease PolX [Opitutales bacterium]